MGYAHDHNTGLVFVHNDCPHPVSEVRLVTEAATIHRGAVKQKKLGFAVFVGVSRFLQDSL